MLQTLAKILPRKKIADLAGDLNSVGGYTGRGEVDFTAWRTADVFFEGARVASIKLENGRAVASLDTRAGDDIAMLDIGGRIEIRQNGDVILMGVLAAD